MNEFSTGSGHEGEPRSGKIGFRVTVTSYVSILPFVGLAAWIWTHNPTGAANHVLAIYAALMFVYTGAVQWGWAIADHPGLRIYLWSMLALVVGWILASLPWYDISLPLLAIATAGFWYLERRWFSQNTPGWYRAVRAQTAILAALALVTAWIAVLIHHF
ncbi:MAG: DUF3429 domain-containing protein [Gammaproteobacteria bacterium]